MNNNNTDVIAELIELRVTYEKELAISTSNEEKDKLQNLINATNNNIVEYEFYMNNNSITGSFHLIYSPAVSLIIAWFNNQGYYLAAELLTHAKENNTVNSEYTPVYGDRVLLYFSSNEYKNKRKFRYCFSLMG